MSDTVDNHDTRPTEWRVCPVILEQGFTKHYLMWSTCAQCDPYWERFPVCPEHGSKLGYNHACYECGEVFNTTNKPSLDSLLLAMGR